MNFRFLISAISLLLFESTQVVNSLSWSWFIHFLHCVNLFQIFTFGNIQTDSGATTIITKHLMLCPVLMFQLYMACYLFELINNEVIKNVSMYYLILYRLSLWFILIIYIYYLLHLKCFNDIFLFSRMIS